MGILSMVAGLFKSNPLPVFEEATACACGGQCTCSDAPQQESVSSASITDEDSRPMPDAYESLIDVPEEEVTVVVKTVIEEVEEVVEAVEAVTEEKETLSEDVISAADEVVADMLEETLTSTNTTASVTDSKSKAKRKRKVYRKSRNNN